MLEAVLFEHGKENGNGEGALRQSKSAAETTDFVCDCFVWLCLVPLDSLVVHVLQQLLPCRLDLGDIAMVRNLVNEQTDIIVTSIVGIVVEEL
jgi:hypothetical protein